MPVVIDYTPAGSVDMASNIALRRQQERDAINAQRASATDLEYANLAQQRQTAGRQAALANAQMQEQARQADQNLQFRYDELAQQRDLAEAKNADSVEIFTDADGNQFELSPEQARTARNLEAFGPDAREAGMRKLLGVPAQDLMNFETPDGQTVKVTPDKYLAYTRQQEQDQARNTLARSKADLDVQKLNLQMEAFNLRKAGAAADQLADVQKRIFEAEDRSDEFSLDAALTAVQSAVTELNARAKQQEDLERDPLYPQLLLKAQAAMKELETLQGEVAKRAAARKSQLQPSTTPSTTVNKTPSYTATAVNSKGERVGYNPETKKWEPLK